MPKKKSGAAGSATRDWKYIMSVMEKGLPDYEGSKSALASFAKEMQKRTIPQAEWADRFARTHKATIGAKKKPKTAARTAPKRKMAAPRKKTVTKVTTTRRRLK